jgi:hypothetical protein
VTNYDVTKHAYENNEPQYSTLISEGSEGRKYRKAPRFPALRF